MTTGFGLASALALQPNVKIVVAGRPSARMTLARCNPDGSLDLTFSSGGRVITDFGGPLSRATALAVQPDGKIVVAGCSGDSTFIRARWHVLRVCGPGVGR